VRTLTDRQLQMFPHLFPPDPPAVVEVRREPRPRVAVLVDAENVPCACWPRVRRIVEMLGDIALVRAYSCTASGWGQIDAVHHHHTPNAKGPNAADIVLAMDAAALLTSEAADTFAVVTGDDDFGAMAYDLVRRGATVHALVPTRTAALPKRLIAFADLTFLVETTPPPASFHDLLRRAYTELSARPRDWVLLHRLGARARELGAPFAKGSFRQSVEHTPGFELRDDGGPHEVYVRATS
jgi:hypothetical protein